MGGDFLRVFRELDAAGLAAPADVDLGLDDDREATQRLGGLQGFLRRVGKLGLGQGHVKLA